ncbi:MAG: hypothetical protein D6800_13990 [Candidatus Zixiibacteriota bacterium]|nr:MAG: hypothetical protein D6800_13990 [candidate division Zixibacteria bacterium]
MKRVLVIAMAMAALLVLSLLWVGCSGKQEAKQPAPQKTMQPDSTQIAAARAAMNKYITETLVANDSLFPVDSMMGKFDHLHDGTKAMDGEFVSCADVTVGQDTYDVDLYVKDTGGAYAVVKEVLHKKNGEPVNKVLWEK